MINAVVKHSVYAGGQSVVLGRYITPSDTIKNIEFMGSTIEANRMIEKLKNNGSEFQCVTIHER